MLFNRDEIHNAIYKLGDLAEYNRGEYLLTSDTYAAKKVIDQQKRIDYLSGLLQSSTDIMIEVE